MQTTDGHLLNGRVRYAQPAEGFRSGLEPVLLAAAVPARDGERVLEAGSGAGAALLCLAARVPRISGLGVERDAGLVSIATRNAVANGCPTLTFQTGDIASLDERELFNHACANPPYHAGGGTESPDARRDSARRADPELFGIWAAAMGRALRLHGTLTWIVSAAAVPACLAAMEAAGCAPSGLLPLWPRRGTAAKLILLRGIKGGRRPFRVASGLVLHERHGEFTTEANAILRDAQALEW